MAHSHTKHSDLIKLWKLHVLDENTSITLSHLLQHADCNTFDGRSKQNFSNQPRPQLCEYNTPNPSTVYSIGTGSLVMNACLVFQTPLLYDGLLGGTELIELSSTRQDWVLVNVTEIAPPGRPGHCEYCSLQGLNIPLFRLRCSPTELFCVTGRLQDYHVSFKHTYEHCGLHGVEFIQVWQGGLMEIEHE